MTASPISDLNPVFMASGAKLTIVSRGELPHAEGPAGEKSRKMGYFLEGQSPRSNEPAVL